MWFLSKWTLTVLQVYRGLKQIALELVQYFTNPYILLIVLRGMARINRNIRVIWLTRRTGRPPISEEIRTLIIEMKQLNPNWGALTISNELKKIGLKASKETVLKILREEGFIKTPPHNGLSWNEFLDSHAFKIGVDFTCLLDLFGRQYFIFVILDLDSRVLLHINATLHPTREWVAQQFRNALMDFDAYPTLCIADRDGIYGQWLKPFLKDGYGMELRRIPFKQPWKNGRVERFHRSLKDQAFANVILISAEQVQRQCWRYKNYYNEYRCHQALDGRIPTKQIGPNPRKVVGFERKTHLYGKIVSFEPAFQAVA